MNKINLKLALLAAAILFSNAIYAISEKAKIVNLSSMPLKFYYQICNFGVYPHCGTQIYMTGRVEPMTTGLIDVPFYGDRNVYIRITSVYSYMGWQKDLIHSGPIDTNCVTEEGITAAIDALPDKTVVCHSVNTEAF